MSSITVQMSAGAMRREAVPARAARSRLHITRRGRLVLVALATAPLLAAMLWFGMNSGLAAASDHSASSSASLEHVTVTQGESLWQIAEKVAPRDDPRDVVAAIVDMNGLQSSVVMPGQTLAIPPQFAK